MFLSKLFPIRIRPGKSNDLCSSSRYRCLHQHSCSLVRTRRAGDTSDSQGTASYRRRDSRELRRSKGGYLYPSRCACTRQREASAQHEDVDQETPSGNHLHFRSPAVWEGTGPTASGAFVSATPAVRKHVRTGGVSRPRGGGLQSSVADRCDLDSQKGGLMTERAATKPARSCTKIVHLLDDSFPTAPKLAEIEL